MAIQWADDFTRYGVGDQSRGHMLEGLPYASLGSLGSTGFVTDDPDPNESGLAYLIGGNGNDWWRDMRIALPTVVAAGTLGVAARMWIGTLPATTTDRPTLIHFQNGAATRIVYIRVELNGSIQIIARVADAEAVVADTVNPVVAPGQWNHYELEHNNATGEGTLWLNGVQLLTYTGVDTDEQLELVNFSRRNGSLLGASVYIKDLVIWDGTGSQNNTTAGTVIVRRLSPNADNTLGGWTPSTGSTAFDLLAKSDPDDTTYMEGDDTPPAPMIVDLENLPPDITSVRALIPVVRMRKIDGGDATIQNALTPDGTNFDNGLDRPINTAFTYFFDVSELDPATAAAWTPLAVDGARLRIDRTT